MLLLLALLVFAVVALVHRYLQMYAPSNVLVRRVRWSAPTWRMAAGLLVAALVLVGVLHVLARAIEEGAPGWLNLVVLVLAWDAIKIGALGCLVLARRVVSSFRPARSRHLYDQLSSAVADPMAPGHAASRPLHRSAYPDFVGGRR